MADDVSAGRLHLDAYADTSGFARDAKAKIDAATRDLRAKIKVELNSTGTITQAREAAKKAQEAAQVRLKTSLDTRALVTQAKTAAAAASAAAKVSIKAKIDQTDFAASLTAATRALDNRYSVTVGVDLDTAAAQTRLAAFRASQRTLPISMGVNIDTGNLSSVISQFAMMPALAGGVFILVSAVGQLAAGLVAVASSASQAVSTMAVLPNLIGVLGQGVGTLFAGLSGIGEGVAALGEADVASAAQTGGAAAVRQQAAKSVATAQRDMSDAYHQAADAARMARYAVQDAEWGLARAQEASADAQVALNEARKAARENIDDLNDSLDRAILSEENAANALAKAKTNLQDVMYDKSSTGQEQRDAELAVKNAKQDYADAQSAREDMAKEAREATKEGVSGSEQVEQARDSLRDANHSLMLAERQLFEARHSAADTAAANAKMLQGAQQGVQAANLGTIPAIKAQNIALADQASAFDELTPAAQKFALFLFDTVMPRFGLLRDHIQAALLPPLQTGITKAMPLIDTLETGLLGTAKVIGNLAIRVGRLFGSEGFNNNTASIMSTNNKALRIFGGAAIQLIKALSDLAVVAGPTLLVPFAKWIRTIARGWAESVRLGRETGTLRDRLVRARESAALLGSILGNLWDTLRGVGRAATPLGDRLLNTFDQAAERWANWTNSDAGQQRMTEFFDSVEGPFNRMMTLIGDVSELFARMAETGGGPVVGAMIVLSAIVNGLNKVLATPYLGTFVGYLFGLAGAAGVVGLLAGKMVGLAQTFAMLSRITGLTRLFNLFRGSLLATRIGLMWITVQSKLAAAGMWIMNTASKALALAMRVLGISTKLAFGLWVVAILAVAGLFVLLYKKVDWFRNAVDWVWGKIVDGFNWVKDAAVGLWDTLFGHSVFPDIVDGLQWFWGIVKSVFGFISGAIKVLGSVFSWLWKNAVQPAWNLIGKAISLVWNYYYKPIFKALGKAIQIAGAVMTWLWKNAVQPAWRGVQKAIAVAWPIIKRIFGLVRNGVKAIGSVFSWLWKNVVTPVWKGIRKAISVAWAGIKVYIAALRLALRVVGAVFSWLWKNIVTPVWAGIRKAISVAWGVVKGVFNLLRKGLGVVGDAMAFLWEKVVEPVWEGISESISDVWTFIRDKVFDPLMDVVKNDIPAAFETAKNNIKTVWDKIKAIAKAPVNFVVETVYNNGIRRVVNAIPGLDGTLPEIHMATGGVLPGYTPGRDVHRFVNEDGTMGLNLSGGEGIARPEVVRQVGSKAWDSMNAAAARGGNALQGLLMGAGATAGPMPDGTVDHSRATGGIIPAMGRSLSFFLGGVMPLTNASVSQHHDAQYASYPWAGDLNYPGRADYGAPIKAWKSGVANPFDLGYDDSYGRGQAVNHASGSSFYAHMSRVITSLAGQHVRAGQTIGYVGDYGNTGSPPTSHLHFEVRNGSIDTSDMGGGGGGLTPAQIKRQKEIAAGKKEKGGWLDFVGKIINMAKGFPSMLSRLGDLGGWAPMMLDAVRSMGGTLRNFINDKIPNEIEIPGPNLPLPDNPIPSLFDRGGDWVGGLGINASGKTETVFTNENIVDLTSDLARISSGLRAQTIERDGGAGGGAGLHVDHLELRAEPGEVPKVLGDMQHALRILSLGGVHAKRLAGASV